MNAQPFHEYVDMPDKNFPIKIFHASKHRPGVIHPNHWHEQIEFWFLKEGNALIECNQKPINVEAGDLIVVNSNELHFGYNVGDHLEFYCIIMDISLLQSSFTDICETKYIIPITQNYIFFRNKIHKDPKVTECIHNIVEEYSEKKIGFELSIKSSIYRLLVLLLRNYVEGILSPKEYETRVMGLQRLNSVLQYIENNYTESIRVEYLSKMVNISPYHFCRMFKKVTGKTLSEYVNHRRIQKAEYLLSSTDMNITEVALSTGFNNVSYFTRMFKRYRKTTPSAVRKNG